jgi:prepilin-type N-terminal cleavage/methylation domain-containing protein
MTLQTGRVMPNRRNKSRKGFTFIELILVVLLIGIVVASATPQLGRVGRGLRTDNFAYDMTRWLSTLKDRSIAEAKVYRLVFSEEAGAYWAERAEWRGGDVQLSFKPVKGRYGARRNIPDQASIELEGGFPTFFPSGEGTAFLISVLEEGKEIYSLTSPGGYGTIQLNQVTHESIESNK